MHRWYQQEAIEAAYKTLLSDPKASPVIVAPTGSGKSHIIAGLCERAVNQYKGRVVVLQHRKELIEQNASKIQAAMEGSLKVSLFSAGLKQRDADGDIVVAGIQSMYDKAELLGPRQLIVIDECHLVPSEGEGMYRSFLSDIKERNPRARIVGLTATPYRTGEGYCFGEDRIFSQACYSVDAIRLMDEGFLCRPCSTAAVESVDTSALHKQKGEFIGKEVETLFDGQDLSRAVAEIIEKTWRRHSIMIFATCVRHALAIELELVKQGQLASSIACIFGNTLPADRQAILERFKAMRIKFVINVDVLTTGFDAPVVDAIAILRATASPGLYAQIVGRGMRVDPSKEDFLVLDFGENIQRHGSIDRIRPGRKGKLQTVEQVEKDDAEAEVKTRICPSCHQHVPTTELECECGCIMPVTRRHNDHSDEFTPIIGEGDLIDFKVLDIEYTKHDKTWLTGKPATLRIDYTVQTQSGKTLPDKISEWVGFESDGFALKKAGLWWIARSKWPIPVTIDSALTACLFGGIADAVKIKAKREGKYWKIQAVELGPIPEVKVIQNLEDAPF